MSTLTPRPIIKSWAEDTSNKDAPSQTAIGTGIVYSSAISSSQPNGLNYIIYEAVKNLQRTGGMFGETIPYSKGQSCTILRCIGTFYYLQRFICIYESEISGQTPVQDAVKTTINGLDCYSGGTLNGTYWHLDQGDSGYYLDGLSYAYNASTPFVGGFAAVNIGGRQYVSTAPSSQSVNPETNRSYFMKAPTIDEILSIIDAIYYPKWASIYSNSTYPIRRLGVYSFRGTTVEAFGMFLNGLSFADDGASNQSKFWRSFSSTYPNQCVIDNTAMRGYFFSGSAGGTITVKNYLGRVQAVMGTPILSSGTSEERALIGNLQDDQMQGFASALTIYGYTGAATDYSHTMTNRICAGGSQSNISAVLGLPPSDSGFGTPRVGYNTREATYTGPIPMVVSLIPFGQITL